MRMHLLLKMLCLFVLAACAPLAHAQAQPVYRCLGAHGEPVFSGQPCGGPAPAASNGLPGIRDNAIGGTCAASPQALRQSIADAFARHDVNLMAGLILWRGMGQASTRNALQALAAWLQQPLTGVAIAYATGPPFVNDNTASTATSGLPASAASVASQPPTGFEISTGGDDNRRDFGVVQSGGCWWLTF